MASDREAAKASKASTCYRFEGFLRNLKSRGPMSVQAKGFCATIVTIRFVTNELHQVFLATLGPFLQVE